MLADETFFSDLTSNTSSAVDDFLSDDEPPQEVPHVRREVYSGVFLTTKKIGHGFVYPAKGDFVDVTLTDPDTNETKHVAAFLGFNDQLPRNVERAIQRMKKGEEASVEYNPRKIDENNTDQEENNNLKYTDISKRFARLRRRERKLLKKTKLAMEKNITPTTTEPETHPKTMEQKYNITLNKFQRVCTMNDAQTIAKHILQDSPFDPALVESVPPKEGDLVTLQEMRHAENGTLEPCPDCSPVTIPLTQQWFISPDIIRSIESMRIGEIARHLVKIKTRNPQAPVSTYIFDKILALKRIIPMTHTPILSSPPEKASSEKEKESAFTAVPHITRMTLEYPANGPTAQIIADDLCLAVVSVKKYLVHDLNESPSSLPTNRETLLLATGFQHEITKGALGDLGVFPELLELQRSEFADDSMPLDTLMARHKDHLVGFSGKIDETDHEPYHFAVILGTYSLPLPLEKAISSLRVGESHLVAIENRDLQKYSQLPLDKKLKRKALVPDCAESKFKPYAKWEPVLQTGLMPLSYDKESNVWSLMENNDDDDKSSASALVFTEKAVDLTHMTVLEVKLEGLVWQAADLFALDDEGRLERAKMFRQLGNLLYRSDRMSEARACYINAYDAVRFTEAYARVAEKCGVVLSAQQQEGHKISTPYMVSEEEVAGTKYQLLLTQVTDVAVALKLNLSLIALKKGELREAISHAELASQLGKDNVKAWLRLAEAHKASGGLEHAKTALSKALELEPTNALALQMQNEVMAELKKYEQKIRALFGGGKMFG